MSMLDLVKGISSEPHNRFTVILGKPGSGKTTVTGTYPKPMLYVSIDTDGGGEVLKGYSDDEIKTLQLKSDEPGKVGSKHIQTKLMELLEELKTENHFKTVVFDAYSSVEEGVVNFMEKAKGKKLSLDERGAIGTLMLNLRNKIVDLSRGETEYVAICHIKDKEDVDNTTGEKTKSIVPKMSYNNGNILLERASNVMYCARKTVINSDNTRSVKFLTYLGAHPNMDTKLRTEGKKLESGLYVEDFNYEKLQEIIKGNTKLDEIKKINVVESQENPFSDDTKTKNEGEEW